MRGIVINERSEKPELCHTTGTDRELSVCLEAEEFPNPDDLAIIVGGLSVPLR